MPEIKRSYRVVLSLFLMSLLLAVGLLIYVNVPHPEQLTDTVGDATIQFDITDTVLVTDIECYKVSWSVSGIKGVYLNDRGKVGQGEEQLCYDEMSKPQLRVVFEDDTEKVYSFDVIIAERLPYFWTILGVAGLLLFFSLYFLLAPTLGMSLRSRTGLLRTVGNLVGVTVFTLIAVGIMTELGIRFYFSNYGTEEERIWYLYSGEDIQNRTPELVGAPYTTYLLNPEYEGHNEWGYRGEDIPTDEDTFHIVAIGASTTYGFGLRSVESYPYLLEKTLRERGYKNLQVTNAGVPGHTSFELLTNFQFRVLEIKPDLVIYYGAKNDAELSFEDPGCYNNPSPLYGITTFHGLWRTHYPELPASALYRYFAINVGMMNPPNAIDYALEEIPIAEYCESNETYTDEELLELNPPTFVVRNIRNLISLAQANDIEIVIAEMVYPTDESHVAPDELQLIMPPVKMQATNAVNAAYGQLAEEMGVPHLKTRDYFEIEPGMFWTTVHMTFKGTKQLAEIYADFLIENDLIPPPETDN